jgi:hypothetical protein
MVISGRISAPFRRTAKDQDPIGSLLEALEKEEGVYSSRTGNPDNFGTAVMK